MPARPEEDRHVRQHVADRDRLDIGDRERLRVVGDEGQRPIVTKPVKLGVSEPESLRA